MVIYKTTGELVFEETNLKSGIKNIDLSNFEAGIYFIHIESENFVHVQKVLKQ
jgi:hypothetical protein